MRNDAEKATHVILLLIHGKNVCHNILPKQLLFKAEQ